MQRTSLYNTELGNAKLEDSERLQHSKRALTCPDTLVWTTWRIDGLKKTLGDNSMLVRDSVRGWLALFTPYEDVADVAKHNDGWRI